jgi:hypothetical protein
LIKSRHRKESYLDLIQLEHLDNFEVPSNLAIGSKILAWIVLISSSVVYGGLHMLTWDAHFRTKAEQTLWRISAPTLMGYGFPFVAWVLFIEFSNNTLDINFDLPWAWLPWTGSSPVYLEPEQKLAEILNLVAHGGTLPKKILYSVVRPLMVLYILFLYLATGFMFCASLLYVLARVYLVVECFLSLFHSPSGLFRQPNWGPYFRISHENVYMSLAALRISNHCNYC